MATQTSAGAVIYRELLGGREYLLLKYPTGHWDFCKGRVEENEQFHDTARREIYEETGISDIVFVGEFEDEIHYAFSHKGKTIEKRVLFYLARTKMRDVTLSHEHVDYEWLGFDGAMGRVTYDNARHVLWRADCMLSGL